MPDPQDISTQWKALTPEQRDEALGKMTPEQKQKLATGLGYKAPQPDPGFLDPHPGENYGKAFGRGGIAGLINPILHPINTVEGMGEALVAAGTSAGGGYPGTTYLPGKTGAAAMRGNEQAQAEAQTGEAEQVQQARENPAYTAGSFVVPALVTHGIAKALPKVSEAGGAVARAASGTGKTVGELVKETQKGNAESAAKAVEANKTAIETTLRKRGTVDEKNAQRAAEDAKKTTDNSAERLKAIQANREAEAKHAQAVAETKTKNAAAVREQGKIEPTQEKLNTASQELRARVETAREKALKEGNAKYSTVNEALSPLPADMEKVHSLYADASGALGELQAVPATLNRIGKGLERGELLTYSDEQALYSELGRELSKGTLPGTVYHAYDVLHEGIGEDMQRIADAKGMGQHLLDARNYWRRMKQTFGKPYNPTDAATGTFEKTSPEFAAQEEQANRIRLLSSFDPEIGKVAENIGNLRKGLKALGPQKPFRDVVSHYPEAPASKPVPPAASTTPSRPPIPYAEPEPTTPKTVSKVGPNEVKGAKTDALSKRADRIENSSNHLANTFVALDIIRRGFHGDIGGMGIDIGARAVYSAGKFGIATILRNPKVVDFLTKATPKDIEQIPPDLRGDFPNIVKAAQKQGINVSPALAAMAGSNQKKRPGDFLAPQ